MPIHRVVTEHDRDYAAPFALLIRRGRELQSCQTPQNRKFAKNKPAWRTPQQRGGIKENPISC